MSNFRWRKALLSVIALATSQSLLAFQWQSLYPSSSHNVIMQRTHTHFMQMTAASVTEEIITTKEGGKPSPSGKSYYKRSDGSWKPRKDLNDLFIGERLYATRLPERYVSHEIQ